MALDKKGSLSVLVGIGKKKAGLSNASDASSDMGDDADMGADKADMAIDDLADLVGCAPEKREAFRSAFKNAVAAVDDDSDMGEDESGTAAAV